MPSWLVFLNALFFSGSGQFASLNNLMDHFIKCNHNRNLNIDLHEAMLFFHDFNNGVNFTFPLYEAGQNLRSAYNLDASKRLIVYVPGYKSHIYKTNQEMMRQTFKDENVYLIIIDHFAYTNDNGGWYESYSRSFTYTYHLGKAIGDFLIQLKHPAEKIHGVGHSLGAHMIGFAGETYKNETGKKIWRITGLDPALPCFKRSTDEQLRSGMAEYVEVYHCNSGAFGNWNMLADTDFFFNHGSMQPKCGGGFWPIDSELKAAKCSHKACVKYWTRTVSHPLWYAAWACGSYNDFFAGKCSHNENTIGGYHNPGNATGVFHISTSAYNVD